MTQSLEQQRAVFLTQAGRAWANLDVVGGAYGWRRVALLDRGQHRATQDYELRGTDDAGNVHVSQDLGQSWAGYGTGAGGPLSESLVTGDGV